MYIMELPQPTKTHLNIFVWENRTAWTGGFYMCWYVKTIKLEQWPKPTQSGDTARKAADSIICDWKGICDTDPKQVEPIIMKYSQLPTRLHSQQYISKDCTELVVCNISYVSIYNMFNQKCICFVTTASVAEPLAVCMPLEVVHFLTTTPTTITNKL